MEGRPSSAASARSASSHRSSGSQRSDDDALLAELDAMAASSSSSRRGSAASARSSRAGSAASTRSSRSMDAFLQAEREAFSASSSRASSAASSARSVDPRSVVPPARPGQQPRRRPGTGGTQGSGRRPSAGSSSNGRQPSARSAAADRPPSAGSSRRQSAGSSRPPSAGSSRPPSAGSSRPPSAEPGRPPSASSSRSSSRALLAELEALAASVSPASSHRSSAHSSPRQPPPRELPELRLELGATGGAGDTPEHSARTDASILRSRSAASSASTSSAGPRLPGAAPRRRRPGSQLSRSDGSGSARSERSERIDQPDSRPPSAFQSTGGSAFKSVGSVGSRPSSRPGTTEGAGEFDEGAFPLPDRVQQGLEFLREAPAGIKFGAARQRRVGLAPAAPEEYAVIRTESINREAEMSQQRFDFEDAGIDVSAAGGEGALSPTIGWARDRRSGVAPEVPLEMIAAHAAAQHDIKSQSFLRRAVKKTVAGGSLSDLRKALSPTGSSLSRVSSSLSRASSGSSPDLSRSPDLLEREKMARARDRRVGLPESPLDFMPAADPPSATSPLAKLLQGSMGSFRNSPGASFRNSPTSPSSHGSPERMMASPSGSTPSPSMGRRQGVAPCLTAMQSDALLKQMEEKSPLAAIKAASLKSSSFSAIHAALSSMSPTSSFANSPGRSSTSEGSPEAKDFAWDRKRRVGVAPALSPELADEWAKSGMSSKDKLLAKTKVALSPVMAKLGSPSSIAEGGPSPSPVPSAASPFDETERLQSELHSFGAYDDKNDAIQSGAVRSTSRASNSSGGGTGGGGGGGFTKNVHLRAAASVGELKTIRALVAEGIRIDDPDDSGWTALHHACSNDKESAVLLLLKLGAHADAVTSSGSTPLWYAKTKNIVRSLLIYGALPDHVNDYGETPTKFHETMQQRPIAVTIRTLVTAKGALAEAELCFEREEWWMAMRLCQLGSRVYDPYDPLGGRKVRERILEVRRMSQRSLVSSSSSGTDSVSSDSDSDSDSDSESSSEDGRRPGSTQIATCLYAWDAEDESQLTMKVDDVLQVTDTDNEEWLGARGAKSSQPWNHGQEGYVPLNYVELKDLPTMQGRKLAIAPGRPSFANPGSTFALGQSYALSAKIDEASSEQSDDETDSLSSDSTRGSSADDSDAEAAARIAAAKAADDGGGTESSGDESRNSTESSDDEAAPKARRPLQLPEGAAKSSMSSFSRAKMKMSFGMRKSKSKGSSCGSASDLSDDVGSASGGSFSLSQASTSRGRRLRPGQSFASTASSDCFGEIDGRSGGGRKQPAASFNSTGSDGFGAVDRSSKANKELKGGRSFVSSSSFASDGLGDGDTESLSDSSSGDGF